MTTEDDSRAAGRYEVYRVLVGRGLVDYCGVVTADSPSAAEAEAQRLYPFDPARERLDVVEAQ